MKNKLIDLNNHLFLQMERLLDEELSDEEFIREIDRSKSASNLAAQIINNANLALKASVVTAVFLLNFLTGFLKLPHSAVFFVYGSPNIQGSNL